MLQVNHLRTNPEGVKERLAVKHFKEPSLVDEIIALDDQRKALGTQFDETKAKINAASKEIGMLMGKGEKEAAEQRKKEVEGFKNTLGPIEQGLAQVEK